MAKFADLQAGPRARKSIILPLPGAQIDPTTGEWIAPEKTVLPKLDVRPLREDEYDDVLVAALAEAKKKGTENPEEGDVVYERSKMLHTILLACIDSDSPVEAPEAYFSSVEQIRKSDLMTPEIIGYLFLQQQLWQDEISPLKKGMTPSEYFSAVMTTAQGNMSFFVNSRPGSQWTFLRTMASQLVAYLSNSSPSTPSSEPQPTNDSATG